MVLAAPYLSYALDSRPDSLTRQEARFSLDWASLVLPRADRLLDLTWWAPSAGHVLDNAAYVGVPLLLVLLGLTVFGWRRRLVRLLGIGFVVVIALASGPHLIVDGRQYFALPWGFIWSLPFFQSAEPVRLIDFAYLLLSLAFALWLTELSIRRLAQAARWALAAVALAAVLADLPTFASVVAVPPPTHWKQALPALKLTNDVPAFFADGTYKKYVQPGQTVVVVSHRGNAGMLFQAYTGFYFKIAGGFINASLSRVDALPAPVGLLSPPDEERARAFEAYVRSAGISDIIVERAWSERWMYVFGKNLGLKSHTSGGITIYSTVTMKQVGLPPHQVDDRGAARIVPLARPGVTALLGGRPENPGAELDGEVLQVLLDDIGSARGGQGNRKSDGEPVGFLVEGVRDGTDDGPVRQEHVGAPPGRLPGRGGSRLLLLLHAVVPLAHEERANVLAEGLDDVDVAARLGVDRVVLGVPGQHDVLAGERPRQPAAELRGGDAVSLERRRAGRLFSG